MLYAKRLESLCWRLGDQVHDHGQYFTVQAFSQKDNPIISPGCRWQMSIEASLALFSISSLLLSVLHSADHVRVWISSESNWQAWNARPFQWLGSLVLLRVQGQGLQLLLPLHHPYSVSWLCQLPQLASHMHGLQVFFLPCPERWECQVFSICS